MIGIKNSFQLYKKTFSSKACSNRSQSSIEALNSVYNFFISYKEIPEKTIKQGALLDNFTFAIKDNISTKVFPTTCGSAFLKGVNFGYNATVVELIFKEGGSVIGKTNMDEFGMGSFTNNPVFGVCSFKNKINKKTYSSGGSSGGSAVAVYYDTCDVSIGTDTGGSVRLPSSFTGLFGFKPSYGQVSRYGVVEYANSLDTVGIISRDINKIKNTYKTISKHDSRDPTSIKDSNRKKLDEVFKNSKIQLQDINICYVDISNIPYIDKEVRSSYKKVIDDLTRMGIKMKRLKLSHMEDALSAYYIIALAECGSNMAKYSGAQYGNIASQSYLNFSEFLALNRNKYLGEEVKSRILLGVYSVSTEQYMDYFQKALQIRTLVQSELNQAFRLPNLLLEENSVREDANDFIILPTSPFLPPLLQEIESINPSKKFLFDLFTVPFSLAGLPSINIPHYLSSDKEDIGVQLVGQFGSDNQVLSVAEELKKLL